MTDSPLRRRTGLRGNEVGSAPVEGHGQKGRATAGETAMLNIQLRAGHVGLGCVHGWPPRDSQNVAGTF